MALTMVSCYPLSITPDPYIVSKSRQKENVYYVPSSANTSLLCEKNDFSFNLVRTSGEKFDGVETQVAFLPAKHFGLIGSYSFANNKDGDMDYMKFNRFELGAGYIKQISKWFLLETYGGVGKGKITNTHYTGFSKENLTHLFLQPAVAVNNEKKTVQFAFVSKFSAVNFNVTDTAFNTDREPFSTAQLASLDEEPFHIIWEPGFIFRFGWKHVLFHTGYNFSSDITNHNLYRPKGILSIGFSLQLNTSKQEKLTE
jgi:hypothetical protein